MDAVIGVMVRTQINGLTVLNVISRAFRILGQLAIVVRVVRVVAAAGTHTRV